MSDQRKINLVLATPKPDKPNEVFFTQVGKVYDTEKGHLKIVPFPGFSIDWEMMKDNGMKLYVMQSKFNEEE